MSYALLKQVFIHVTQGRHIHIGQLHVTAYVVLPHTSDADYRHPNPVIRRNLFYGWKVEHSDAWVHTPGPAGPQSRNLTGVAEILSERVVIKARRQDIEYGFTRVTQAG